MECPPVRTTLNRNRFGEDEEKFLIKAVVDNLKGFAPLHERQRQPGRGTPTCHHNIECRHLIDPNLRQFMQQSGGAIRSTIFGYGRGGPDNLPVVPDPPAFAAHTACDLNGATRQRARRPPGALKRLSEHMHTPAAHVVLPSWTSPVAVTGAPADAA